MLAFLFSACLFLVDDKPATAVSADAVKLNGEWTMVSGERDGTPLPDEFVKKARRICKDGESAIHVGDQVMSKVKFTVDATKKPNQIDFTVLEGQYKDRKQVGIYEIDGETLKVCLGGPDNVRPTEFKSKAGSGQSLTVWKRAKK